MFRKRCAARLPAQADYPRQLAVPNPPAVAGQPAHDRPVGQCDRFTLGVGIVLGIEKHQCIALPRPEVRRFFCAGSSLAGFIAAFGHEFGHVIQVRVGPAAAGSPPDPRRYPSIIVEEAADCYAGAFLNWVTTGHAPHLHLPRSALVRALAPLLNFRDPIDLPADDPIAHGLALDRLQAVLAGLRTGPTACQAMNADNVQQTQGRPEVTTANKIPRFPSEQTVLTAARKSVAQFVTAELPGDVNGLKATTETGPPADDLNLDPPRRA